MGIEVPKHVERIINAIKPTMTCSWFFLLYAYATMRGQTHTSSLLSGSFLSDSTGKSRYEMLDSVRQDVNPYPTSFPYGNGMVLHFYQQQESSTTKTVHKVITKGLKAYVYSLHTGENFH